METTSVGGASSVDFGHSQSHRVRTASSSANPTASTSTVTVVPEVEIMLRPLPPDHHRSSAAPLDGASAEPRSNPIKSEDAGHVTTAPSPHAPTAEASFDETAFCSAVKYVKVPPNATGRLLIFTN